MTEQEESSATLLQDEALLQRVLQREPSLVSRIVGHTDFLEALFSQAEALRGLMRAPLVHDDYQFEQLLASVGGDGASLHLRPGRDEARLLNLLNDSEALGRLFRQRPRLAAAVTMNPAFVEQVKVRKPHFYRALLEKAQDRFGTDPELAQEIRADQKSLVYFTSEGGKKETEAERKLRAARAAGEKLLEAAKDGKSDDVRTLLEEGADPNFQDNCGVTALMLAANKGHSDSVRVLLDGKADPNLPDVYGVTALMLAARNGHTESVQALLQGGADPRLRDEDERTAQDVAKTFSIAELLAAAERKHGRHGGPQQERGR